MNSSTNAHNNLVNLASLYPGRVLVVDDDASQVDALIRDLKRAGYVVDYARDNSEANSFIRMYVYDIALIDVFIRLDSSDIKPNSIGLSIATMIADRCPETVVVFISRPHVISAEIVLQMFNYNHEYRRHRLSEAYIEKSDTSSIVSHCEMILKYCIHTDVKAPLYVDEKWWSEIPDMLKRKVFSSDDAPVMSDTQISQIIRQLASHEQLPLIDIEIRPIGRGRSRTVVFAMLCRYRPTETEHVTVVKIGRTGTVQAERENYLKYVVGFFQAGAYPMLTGYSESRQLSGVAYSFLGTSSSDPPTLADQFWNIDHSDALLLNNRIFNELLMPAKPPREANGLLCNFYLSRFLSLKAPDLIDRISSALRRAGCNPVGSDRLTFTTPSDWSVSEIPNPVNLVRESFFDGYWEKVVHGDLHSDNILLLNSGVFLIDFAHTGIGHVFCDHIVLEVSVRMHLMRRFQNM